jgi:hypothetical protein
MGRKNKSLANNFLLLGEGRTMFIGKQKQGARVSSNISISYFWLYFFQFQNQWKGKILLTNCQFFSFLGGKHRVAT